VTRAKQAFSFRSRDRSAQGDRIRSPHCSLRRTLARPRSCKKHHRLCVPVILDLGPAIERLVLFAGVGKDCFGPPPGNPGEADLGRIDAPVPTRGRLVCRAKTRTPENPRPVLGSPLNLRSLKTSPFAFRSPVGLQGNQVDFASSQGASTRRFRGIPGGRKGTEEFNKSWT
jgi:hypothetical protein